MHTAHGHCLRSSSTTGNHPQLTSSHCRLHQPPLSLSAAVFESRHCRYSYLPSPVSDWAAGPSHPFPPLPVLHVKKQKGDKRRFSELCLHVLERRRLSNISVILHNTTHSCGLRASPHSHRHLVTFLARSAVVLARSRRPSHNHRRPLHSTVAPSSAMASYIQASCAYTSSPS
ncbi:hypothetical protein PIB30_014938 [Stylosanthes scabra]|uniref:Uncharacterized protein n=1 Tax=Stylosanthes scabra TaxID=79078 RepID=A0ABU6W6I1_9FABA|nr:hypothetical protein [Stylosanthes scabra]